MCAPSTCVLSVQINSELKVAASKCTIEPMVHAYELRAAFAQRLKTAIAAEGMEEWGAQARIAKETGVTPKAVSKWMNSESMPSAAKLLALAKLLNVRREWLQYGDGGMRPGSVVQEPLQPYVKDIEALAGLATPRSLAVLDRLGLAARQGRLTEEDIDLLDRIASRFEGANKTPLPDNKGSHQRLRDKLKSHDRDTEK